ncbi:MAG: 3'-5'-exoribonuclease [Bogoriella megaspora]|nr:MAG: 3'-5'-exoribonuclease [Bogoriella megaspora]
MADRRRINAPSGGTAPPVFLSTLSSPAELQSLRPTRTRRPDELRKIFLKTGLNPSASGSAYLELPPPPSPSPATSLLPSSSSLKLTCSIHGPHPLPRSSPYSPYLSLTTIVKFAPFASRIRRGYVRDAQERDLAAHLDTALRGVVIGERWPKSGVDICVTVLEGEEDEWWGRGLLQMNEEDEDGGGGGWGAMSVLAGCVTVASAALVDAGIDCVDLVSGGVAAVVGDGARGKGKQVQGTGAGDGLRLVLDPTPAEHDRVVAAALVAYLKSRDEITELWVKGDAGVDAEDLINGAVHAAVMSRTVLTEALKEAGEKKFGDATPTEKSSKMKGSGAQSDAEMTG